MELSVSLPLILLTKPNHTRNLIIVVNFRIYNDIMGYLGNFFKDFCPRDSIANFRGPV